MNPLALLLVALLAALAFLAWYYPAPARQACPLCRGDADRVLYKVVPVWLCRDGRCGCAWGAWDFVMHLHFDGWFAHYREGDNYTRAMVRRIRHALFCRCGGEHP